MTDHAVGVRIVGGHPLLPGDVQAVCSCGWEGEKHSRHPKDTAQRSAAGAKAQAEALAHVGGQRHVVERTPRVDPALVTAPEMFPDAGRRVAIDSNRAHVGRRHPATAQTMQANALPRSGTFRRQMYDVLLAKPMTDFEMEDLFGRSHQSVSGCRATLYKDGWLRPTGQTRRNKYGNDAIVWAVVE